MTDDDAIARQKALLLHAANFALGGVVADLTRWRLTPAEQRAYDDEVARLATEYQSQMAMMDRYLGSRAVAVDDNLNEWVIAHDPINDSPIALQVQAMMQKEKTDDRS